MRALLVSQANVGKACFCCGLEFLPMELLKSHQLAFEEASRTTSHTL